MPDFRKHRGAHPEDRKLFGNDRLQALRTAVNQLSWLLTRNYSVKGAEKLVADRNGWPWTVETVHNPDREIVSSDRIVIASDGPLLDQANHWTNFNRHLIEKKVAASWLVDLSC